MGVGTVAGVDVVLVTTATDVVLVVGAAGGV
jgi:hypothetical protein